MSIIFRRHYVTWGGVPTASVHRRVRRHAASLPWSGIGFLAGEPPADPDDPDSPDGRTRIDGALASCRVQVLSRIGMVVVAQTRSASDGTWRIEGLNPDVEFVVVGLDDAGTVNGAMQDRVRPAVA